MKSTRERILQTLLGNPHATIADLAEAVGINTISVRHHLTSLQAEGLIAAEEERHGVGRPRMVYFLTEKGLERFPTRYLRLTNRLLDQLKESLPAPVINQIFTEIAVNIASSVQREARSMNIEERLDLIQKLLVEEGFSIQWEKQGAQYQIHETSCPYYRVGQNHPEVCTMGQTLISTVLEIPAEKVHCVLRGDTHCTFDIPNLTENNTKTEK